jgi:hypothetical protein
MFNPMHILTDTVENQLNLNIYIKHNISLF